jgi:hypothetical protein
MHTAILISSFLYSEEFLSSINPYLLDAEIAAAALLGVGIIFESHTFNKGSKSVERVGFWCVVIGIVLFKSETWIADQQRTEIVALNKRLAERSLSSYQIASIGAALRIYSGLPFQIRLYPENPESEHLARNIRDTLSQNAKWDFQPPSMDDETLKTVVTGVVVSISGGEFNQRASDAADALVRELKSNEIISNKRDAGILPGAAKIQIDVGIRP